MHKLLFWNILFLLWYIIIFYLFYLILYTELDELFIEII